ncbi:helix-turn-helix domain-containing protein [Rhodomicrobium sp. Az07]|uniref:helix-turn-helix domain-containing protein n=1 Tax=Rhodomicrobium sp. Az07 TaxID=2839034 RepID=UPI0035302243
MTKVSVTPTQFRMARAALLLTVRELAEIAGVHRNTIIRIEAGEASHGPTVAAVQRALEEAGIMFLMPGETHGPGVALKPGVAEPRRVPGATSASEGSDGGMKARDPELAAFWEARPAGWAELSEEGRRVISEAAFGDAFVMEDGRLRG